MMRQVRRQAVVHVGLRGKLDDAAKAHQGHAIVEKAEIRDSHLLATLCEGNQGDLELPALFIQAGHRLVASQEEDINLETAFMALTKGASRGYREQTAGPDDPRGSDPKNRPSSLDVAMADDDRGLQEQVRELTAEVKRLRHSVIMASIILGAMILLASWGTEGFLKSALAAVIVVVFVLAAFALSSATIEGLRKTLGKRVE